MIRSTYATWQQPKAKRIMHTNATAGPAHRQPEAGYQWQGSERAGADMPPLDTLYTSAPGHGAGGEGLHLYVVSGLPALRHISNPTRHAQLLQMGDPPTLQSVQWGGSTFWGVAVLPCPAVLQVEVGGELGCLPEHLLRRVHSLSCGWDGKT
jgi:hypothetical protein